MSSDFELAKKLEQEWADEEYAKKLQNQAQPKKPAPPSVYPIHPFPYVPPKPQTVAEKVCNMVYDSQAKKYADNYGLNINTVSWEDTARTKNSSWGPNISDMTLVVDGHQLPVIRAPNYTDLTWDVPTEKIPLVVGNEIGSVLYTVDLKDYLKNFRSYLHKPDDWKGSKESLLADRDSHVIMSAQACFLPVPKSDEATFNVALYNYQSRSDDPAVLAIVVTSKGSSAQVITNSGHRGQKLYFNKNGEKCSFVGVRLSDERKAQGITDPQELKKAMTKEEKQDNMIMVIQVPLKQKPVSRSFGGMKGGNYYADDLLCESSSIAPSMACFAPAPKMMMKKESEKVNVEHAIVKLGESEGKFTEIGGMSIERDHQYPIRVTLQFYKCTDNGAVNDDVMKEISMQMKEAQKKGEFFGSLVVNAKTDRPTEHKQPVKVNYVPAWWDSFWLTYKSNYPKLTEDKAKQIAFSDSRFANTTMSQSEDKLLMILQAGNLGSENKVDWGLL